MNRKYIVHVDSGTYIPLEECALMEVTDEVDATLSSGDVDARDCAVVNEGPLSQYLNQHYWPTFPRDEEEDDGIGC